jgi:hypothetical protein
MCYALGILLLPALLPLALAQDNKTEKLFHDMEKKILAAMSFKVTFDWSVDKRITKGSLILTHDGKARIKIRGDFGEGGPNSTFEAVSDGKQLVTMGSASRGKKWKTPKNFHTVFGTIQSRIGVWASLMGLPYLLAEKKEIALDQIKKIKAGRPQFVGMPGADWSGGEGSGAGPHRYPQGQGICPERPEIRRRSRNGGSMRFPGVVNDRPGSGEEGGRP